MVLIGADVWRLDQARELVQLSQASLPSTHARQPDLAVLPDVKDLEEQRDAADSEQQQ